MNNLPDRTSGTTRRGLAAVLGLGALAVAGYRSGWLDPLLPGGKTEFEPMPGLPGYRFVKGGRVTASGVPLFGLDSEIPAGLADAQAELERDFCGALFRGQQKAGLVPVAYFFDFQCPICRRLTPRLRVLEGVTITLHDLAGLGPVSETAARAAIAADMQGAGDAFHDRLMRARFQADETYVAALAETMGLDAGRFLADMSSDATTRRMWLSRALAGRFAMPGTPGLVIGRWVIMGDVNDVTLRRLVAEELRDPGPCPAG